MNKNILYIIIAAFAGLLIGWLLFGGTRDAAMANKDTSDLSDHDHATEAQDQMWTCSMHPQIMQNEPGDCPICGMDLIPAEASAEGIAPNAIKMTENALALANIRTTRVGGSALQDDNTLSLSGKIQVNEEAKAVQSSYFEGRIERLHVNFEGQQVRQGQLLATLYAPNLIAAQQELLTAASLKESQPKLYQAVRNKLKLWKLSETQINTIEKSGTIKEYFPVYATVSGTVTDLLVAEGDYVNQGQPLVKLSNLNSVWAEFDAYESQIEQLEKGQQLQVTAQAYPNKTFDGTISFIDPVLNTQTRTVTVRAQLNNRDGLLKPGLFITGTLDVAQGDNTSTLSIPASAVLWTGERSVVYVKTAPDTPVFEMREVVLGSRSGDQYTVISGLQEGEEIVTNGTFTVDAAAQLQGKRSMMNQNPGAGNTRASAMDGIKGTTLNLSQDAQKALLSSLQPYLQMKDAMVSGDDAAVSAFAKATQSALNTVSGSALQAAVQPYWTQVIAMLKAIQASENLENQRTHFVVLNEHLVPLMKQVDKLNGALYVQRCPMANDNQGAIWLSAQNEIKNPYFGDAMLNCGSVIDTLN
ncbi:efflux RND transporter periplasmic adaptor subunit [Croceiramulus getboli]|nr:efflux RND transporter periplasmic adaptor subunit [Flavobacteriaceae bacterium YJPT1-3]